MTASIAPVIVPSRVGLLLSSITNRHGRAIDRVQLLARELEKIDTESAQRRRLGDQLRFTNQRAHVLRSSMLSASGQHLLRVTDSPLIVRGATTEVAKRLHRLPFVALCLISLVASMYYSIRDITMSLWAPELAASERIWDELHLP